ncbi:MULTISPECIES: hypothetical protein [unclassified Nostoc]|uniref:hypothetical protein n=1 Tax=unclassified Nostoc TaxID=2593658 RepID=UPI002AD35D4A|nr:hypothetical protein [Nostoc sp. DedQUE03]MDZ7977494.1 hypothetical protein [Nostoc sp. DedQUE03]MDZ8047373.1 hypothetical protein [Nostoc sp. DedQUE02]
MDQVFNNLEIDNMVQALEDGIYVFDLKLLCGGYAYFSTFTAWVGFGKLQREIRKPDLVNIN